MTTINPSALLEPLEASVATYQGPAPAVLLEVARSGLRAQAATGVVSVDQDTPATTEMKFEIGSQTKMMTAAVVLQLAAEGQFDLDEKLSNVIDVTPLTGIANIEEATLRQMLTHSSGIPDYVNDFVNDIGIPTLWEPLLETPPRPVGPAEAIEFLIAQNAPADFAPGESTEYSNTGFLLFQFVIENVTGSPLADVFQARIFDPLGMENSSFPGIVRPDGIISSYATFYDELIDVTDLPIDDAGDGGVVSTTADMIKFMQALALDRTLVPDDQLDGLEQFFEAIEFDANDFIGHSGGTVGMSTGTFAHIPTGTVFSLALTHAGEEQNMSALLENILANVLTNHTWSDFGTGEGTLDFALAAAELGARETTDLDGVSQIQLDMQGVSIVLDGTLAELDTDDLTFEDGSILFIADTADTTFSISRDAVDAVHADNHLIGQRGDDQLEGGFGNDVLRGGEGDDVLNGADGHDIAHYTGDQAQYTLTIGPDGTTITNRLGMLGSDKLVAIEQLDFALSSFDLDKFDGVGQLNAPDLLGLVELYTAYFNRAPDAVGLSFWGTALANWGTALANGTSIADVAAKFMDHDETREIYSEAMSNANFVKTVYQSVFGRSADTEGASFWLSKLEDTTNGVGNDQFILAVLDGARAAPPSWATDIAIAQQLNDRAYLENKTDIGTYFAATLGMSNVEHAIAVMDVFDGSQASMDVAISVSDTYFEAAVSIDERAFLMPIVGVLDDPFA